jgi:hypothetical protein
MPCSDASNLPCTLRASSSGLRWPPTVPNGHQSKLETKLGNRVSAGEAPFFAGQTCGQGQDRTVDLPLFRGSITPKALTWKSPRSPAHAHKGWSTRLSVLSTTTTSVPLSAVSSVGFLWGSPPGRGLVGFLWGSQKALTARKMRHGLGSGAPRSLVTAHARVTERNRTPVRSKGHSDTAEYGHKCRPHRRRA